MDVHTRNFHCNYSLHQISFSAWTEVQDKDFLTKQTLIYGQNVTVQIIFFFYSYAKNTPVGLVEVDRGGRICFHPDHPAGHVYLAKEKMSQEQRYQPFLFNLNPQFA